MAVNSAKSGKNVDFCQYRNDVRPVMATFLVMARLTSFYIYNSTYIIIQSDQNLTCLTACYGHAMFAS